MSDIEKVICNFNEGDTITITPKEKNAILAHNESYDEITLFPSYRLIPGEIFKGTNYETYTLFTKTLFEICSVLDLNVDDYCSFDDVCHKHHLTIENSSSLNPLQNESGYVNFNVFCPNCFKRHTLDELLISENGNEFKELYNIIASSFDKETNKVLGIIAKKSDKGLTFECPDCGEKMIISRYKCMDLRYYDNPKFIAKKIYINYDDNKLSISYLGLFNYLKSTRSTTGDSYYELRAFKGKGKMVWNTKTGQTYLLPIRTPSGRILKRNKIYNPGHLTNITYSNSDYYDSCELLKKVFENQMIVNTISEVFEKFRSNTQGFEDIASEMKDYSYSERINLLARKNRYPYIPTSNLYKSLHVNDTTSEEKRFLKKMPKDVSYEEGLNYAMKYAKSDGAVWELSEIESSLLNTVFIKTIRDIGFTDNGLIKSLYDKIQTSKEKMINYNEMVAKIFSSQFIKDIIKNCDAAFNGESIAAAICDDAISNLGENCKYTEFIYQRILGSSLKNELKNPLLYSGGTVKSVETELTKLYEKIKYENQEFRYSYDDTTKFCNVIGDYDFRLVRNVHELIRVGQELKVGIGDYFESVLMDTKHTKFIIAYNINTKQPVFYIKLLDKCMAEAKGSLNQLIYNREAEALREWVDDLGDSIYTAYCRDYRHIKLNNFYEVSPSKKYDSHHLEITDSGKVIKV